MAEDTFDRLEAYRSRRTKDHSGQAEARFSAYVRGSTDIFFRTNPEWTELRQVDGRGFVVDTLEPRRDWVDKYIPPEEQPRLAATVEKAIKGQAPFELEHKVQRANGTIGWTLSRAVPLFDENGEIYEWFGTTTDVTEHHAMQEEVARLTAASDQQRRFYESLISATPDLVYAFDREYRFIFANQALLQMWGRTLDDSLGKRLLEVGYEPWHAEMHEREIDQVIATKSGIRGEVGFPHAVLGWRIYDYIFMPVLDANGEVEAIAGTTRDITDIKRSEEHLRLLVNELNHRVKNTLATVQSLAKQTFKADTAHPAARVAFEERLMALSNAHTMLTRSNWEGASLREIAANALAPFGRAIKNANRIRMEGKDLELGPQTALALVMALHELASNAVKYGALSNESGQILVKWQCAAGQLHFTWQEADGPRVENPKHRGFGSRLLERNLAKELAGSVALQHLAEGVVCTMEFPVKEAQNEGG